MDKLKVFLIEDDLVYNSLLENFLQQYGNLDIKVFFNGKTAIKDIKANPDILISDYHLPDVKTDDLIQMYRNLSPLTKILVISKEDKMDIIAKLLKSGADDYIIKNENIKALLYTKLTTYKTYFANISKLNFNFSQIHSIIEEELFLEKNSAITSYITAIIKDVISFTPSVYSIIGPKGVGKEFLIKFIKKNSSFSNFVTHEIGISEKSIFLDYCKTVIDNKLSTFKNAYTNGGMFWIKEINQFSLKDQELISRFIDKTTDKNYVGNQNHKFVITSELNLDELLTFNRLFEVLYYQIKLKSIELPSLIDRKKSILIFSKLILKKMNNGKKVLISRQAEKKIKKHAFPGNISELNKCLKIAFSLSDGKIILPENVKFIKNVDEDKIKHPTLEDFCNKIIYNHLVKNNFQVIKTADMLKISKSKVYDLLNKRVLR